MIICTKFDKLKLSNKLFDLNLIILNVSPRNIHLQGQSQELCQRRRRTQQSADRKNAHLAGLYQKKRLDRSSCSFGKLAKC